MTTLRLVESPFERGGGGSAPSAATRLPPGRHGLPPDLVAAHQRQRLVEAAAAALAEQGYGRIAVTRVIELSGVSSATFYQHFDDVWTCLGTAYETEAAGLCEEAEAACATTEGSGRERARAAIGAALEHLAAEPNVARLLTAEPPPQAEELVAGRFGLTVRLGSLLQGARETEGDGSTPPSLERRLIGAALALVSTYVVGDEADRLPELEPALSEFLLAPL